MNANEMLIHGFAATLNQIVATAVAEAVKPLEERIVTLQAAYTDWKAMEHVAAKAVQPMQDRIVALEINQSMGKAVFTLPDVDFNEAVRNVLDGGGYVKRNEVVDLVDTVVTNAIEAYDFNDIIDWDNKIEEGINNYDFREIVEENMPEDDEALTQDKVQQMIDESLDNLTITRN